MPLTEKEFTIIEAAFFAAHSSVSLNKSIALFVNNEIVPEITQHGVRAAETYMRSVHRDDSRYNTTMTILKEIAVKMIASHEYHFDDMQQEVIYVLCYLWSQLFKETKSEYIGTLALDISSEDAKRYINRLKPVWLGKQE